MPTVPGLFGQHTGTIWRAQLPERFKATLQAIMLTLAPAHVPTRTYHMICAPCLRRRRAIT